VYHEPVLVEEVLRAFGLSEGGVYFDGTLGGGGHLRAVKERVGAGVRALGVDRDPDALAAARAELGGFGGEIVLRHGTYADMGRYLSEAGFGLADAALLDLGVSLHQLVTPARGFAHDLDGAPDMRFDPRSGQDALEWIRSTSREMISKAMTEYGDLPAGNRVADTLRRAVVHDRVHTTRELAKRINGAIRVRGRRVSAATLVFQAIRIAINGEFEELDRFMAEFPEHLAEGGVLCVISYHSGEDRRIKRRFRDLSRQGGFELLVKKPIVPTDDEVRRNRQARSAKLRAIRRATCSA
jgi:16S rRNA (cytosine1402-N4)-methyltransferase